jgi:CHAD domain-containing protein
MSYRFYKNETVAENVHRIASEQMSKGLESLEGDGDVHETIHDVRKRFKKLRALMRLVRGSVEDYSRRNRAWRDLGRSLSHLRDVGARIDTVQRLEPEADRIDPVAREDMLLVLQAGLDQIAESDSLRVRIQHVAEHLRNDLQNLESLRVEDEGFDAIDKGLKTTYGRGLKALDKAREEPDEAHMHALRKRAKYHWYHVRLLQGIWPAVLRGRRRECDRLAKTLGHIHDLDVLGDVLHCGDLANIGTETIDEVDLAAQRRRKRLVQEVWPLADRVYAEPAKAMRKRMGALFGTWRPLPVQA